MVYRNTFQIVGYVDTASERVLQQHGCILCCIFEIAGINVHTERFQLDSLRVTPATTCGSTMLAGLLFPTKGTSTLACGALWYDMAGSACVRCPRSVGVALMLSHVLPRMIQNEQ